VFVSWFAVGFASSVAITRRGPGFVAYSRVGVTSENIELDLCLPVSLAVGDTPPA